MIRRLDAPPPRRRVSRRATPKSSTTPCRRRTASAPWRSAPSASANAAWRERVAAFVDFVARQCHVQEVFFRLRPTLADPGDDLALELAFAAGAEHIVTHIVTHNVRDFAGVAPYGTAAVTPGQFLRSLRGRT